ncbi:flagellar hook-length control protein FliK [Vibrio cholerae]
MNVNLTPPVEPGKVASVSKSGAVSAEAAETESSGGFFAQLHALIFGDKTASDSAISPESEAEIVADVLMNPEGESTSVTDSNDVEIIAASSDLLSEEGEKVAGTPAELKAQPLLKGEAGETSAADEKRDAPIPPSIAKWVAKPESADDALASHELKRKTAQAMSEGDEILGRLQEANQALTKSNGKTLPVQNGQALDKHTAELTAKEVFAEEVLPQAEQAKLKAAMPPNTGELDETNALPSDDETAKDELMAATLVGGALAGANALQTDPKDAAALVDELPVEPALAQSSAVVKSEAAMMGDEIAAMGKAPRTTKPTQAVMNGLPQAPNDLLNAEGTVAESGKVAIPWASQVPTEAEWSSVSPELKDQTLDGAKPKALAPNTLAQSVAQGLTPAPAHLTGAERAAVIPTNPAAATPVDMAALAPQAVAANPMVNPASTVNPEVMASSAMLAALGGRSLVGGDERRVTAESGQEGLAQQIAAAAGQGMGQSQALNRAEPQAVQTNATPLHLNKEMAADQLAERVQMMMSKNLKNIDIRLDPPELGRMHIRMNMQGDGATVHFTVANQHAREALEQTMPRLREMLAQQGVQLGDTSVQQQSAGQQQRYTGQEQSGFGQSARNERLNSEENLDTDIKLDLNVATKRDGISYYA